MFTRLLHQTATLLRPGVDSYDAYGNEVLDYPGSGEEQPVLACRIQENDGTEEDDERETVERRAVGFFGPDEAITAYDKFDIDGDIWEVVGEPVLRHDATGPHHYEVNLRRVQV